jgi:hypothetical protein
MRAKSSKSLLVSCGLLMGLGLLLIASGDLHAPNPDRIARVLLASWKANSADAPPAALWATQPLGEFPGFDLSVGRQVSGHGIAMLQRHSHWYGFSRDVAFSLIQSPHNATQWQLAESRAYSIAGLKLTSRRLVLTTITDLQ